jgi:hypothetical protein
MKLLRRLPLMNRHPSSPPEKASESNPSEETKGVNEGWVRGRGACVSGQDSATGTDRCETVGHQPT